MIILSVLKNDYVDTQTYRNLKNVTYGMDSRYNITYKFEISGKN